MSGSLVAISGFHKSSCGYCGGNESHTYGIRTHYLTCQDYQSLIDRGWRRSGRYTYKPNLRDSCCPQYTIKLDATKFQASKSQRKLINKFNRYVEGVHLPSSKDDEGEGESVTVQKEESKDTSRKKKAKNQAVKPFDLIEAIHEAEDKEDWKHRLKIVLEQSSFTKEKYQLYYKYQTLIHKDPPSELSEYGFRRFLVDSPLIFEQEIENTPGYGSFHQLYYLDDKLIAVAVLDILPKCVSSVYYIYDPDYSFLGLGKYSALREISLSKELHAAGYTEMEWYYMGFYIHSCQKMRYKGQYQPSYLLDPETYDWYPLEKFATLLEKQKYVTFSNSNTEGSDNRVAENSKSTNKRTKNRLPPPPGMISPQQVSDELLQQVPIFIYGTATTKLLESLPEIKENSAVMDSLREYVAAVGDQLAKQMAVFLTTYFDY